MTAFSPITSFKLDQATEAEYMALAQFEQLVRQERIPDETPMSTEFLINRWKSMPDFVDYRAWVVWDATGEQIIAGALVQMLLLDTNRQLADLNLTVLPAYRGQGLARTLLQQLAPTLKQLGRNLIMGATNQRIPAGEQFAQHLGAEPGLETHVNQLVLAELDQQLVQQWLEQSQPLSEHFELGMWQGPYPEADLAAIVQLYEVMNQQPHDDLALEPMHFTPEQLRELEQTQLANGFQRWTYYLRERSTQALAGFSEVFWHSERQNILQQGDTGVFEQYRNHGLGRWLKAAMLDYIRRELPIVELVRTTNANSNAPMLKINQALGFKPYLAQTMWQLSLEQLEAYLERS